MYEINLTLNLPFASALEKVKTTLMQHHLGIVSEVNVQAILKAKMDKTVPAYTIYGACNPKLADRVIAAEPNAGTLLPCNFILREEGENTVVSFMDPLAVFALSDNTEVKAVASEARTILDQVVAELQG